MTSQAYEYFRSEGHALAGGADDFGLRAGLYHRMYQDCGKRNVFLLIAAHGTLWAAGYFKKGVLGAWLLSLPYLFTPKLRAAKLRSAAQFADKFRDINRRVCAESYAIFYYTKQYGGTGFIRSVIGNALCDLLCECHASNDFTIAQREKLFSAFCDWEQETVVAPLVTLAFEEIDWPVIRFLALRSRVDVSYLGKSFKVQFTNFTSQDERLMQGLRLCRRAEEMGLDYTERCLRNYAVKPVPDIAAIPCARPGTAPRSTPAPDATARYC
jgi:hypothetical protein